MAAEEADSLESILNRATNPANREENWDSIVAFCDQVNKELEGPQIAVRLISHKIQSPQEREALHTLTTLEACVKNCGQRFHLEIGKFRFLNEMIKVVSPKYLGQHTTEKVKNRCIEILYSWSTGLKHEPKIAEAYAMLKRQGIVKQDPVHIDKTYEPAPPPRAKNAVFEDEDKSKLLARLLRSKHPEDLQAANRLIKNMVKQDAERMDKVSRRMQQLETINNSVKLLNEMLTHFDRSTASEADTDVMKELYENLEKTRPNLFRLASDTDEKDTEGINEILKMSDTVMKTMQMYQQVVEGIVEENGYIGNTASYNKTGGSNLSSLLDLDLSSGTSSSLSSTSAAGLPRPPSGGCQMATVDPLDDSSLLGGGKPQSDIDMLGDLFGTPAVPPPSNSVVDPFGAMETASASANDEFGALLMAPPATAAVPAFAQVPSTTPVFPAMASSAAPAAAAPSVSFPIVPPAPASSSSLLFSDSSVTTGILSGSSSVSASVTTASASVFGAPLPLTASPVLLPSSTPSAASSTSQTAHQDTASKSGLDDLDILGRSLQEFSLTPEKKPLQPSGAAVKIPMNQLAATSTSTATTNPTLRSLTGELIPTPTGSATSSPIKKLANTEILPLTDIFVPLEDIKPGTLPPLIAYNKNDIKTVIHFAKESPRPDVLVMVVSTMSTNDQPIKSFIFQSAVPKSMRVKLQPPSATDLPAYNPILPPAAITQVMLIANPHKEKIRLKYKVSYKMNENPVTDVGDVDTFPVQ